jgi:divalent metal cation (Fe/Co/Zn/Cd) transporter
MSTGGGTRAIIILVVAVGLEGFSFRTAIHESRGLKGRLSWWQFIRQATTPELPVVLLEDFGALIGLVLALLGVGLTALTGNPVFDALGTIGIGILLGIIAIVLIVEMKSLLIGEGARPPMVAAIVDGITGGEVQSVIHLRTQYLGPEELLVAAKIALTPGLPMEDVARAIDEAEARVRAAVPAARMIYLEPDLERTVTPS